MKKQWIYFIIGALIGAAIALFIAYKLLPSVLILEIQSKYDFTTTSQRLEEEVTKHGWRMPAVHDLQATMANFGISVKPVKVFEICQPEYAGKILERNEERATSALMPCRVAVYEKKAGKVYISMINSKLMAKAMGGVVDEVMSKAFEETRGIIQKAVE